MTSLHYAAQEGHAKILALLLRCGGDRGKVDAKGRTPLVIARGKEGEKWREVEVRTSGDERSDNAA